jgi:hypothetical protein
MNLQTLDNQEHLCYNSSADHCGPSRNRMQEVTHPRTQRPPGPSSFDPYPYPYPDPTIESRKKVPDGVGLRGHTPPCLVTPNTAPRLPHQPRTTRALWFTSPGARTPTPKRRETRLAKAKPCDIIDSTPCPRRVVVCPRGREGGESWLTKELPAGTVAGRSRVRRPGVPGPDVARPSWPSRPAASTTPTIRGRSATTAASRWA